MIPSMYIESVRESLLDSPALSEIIKELLEGQYCGDPSKLYYDLSNLAVDEYKAQAGEL